MIGQGQGMSTYASCLRNARTNQTVGEQCNASPQIRSGMVGKKLTKKAKKELADKMFEAAKRKPHLMTPALNVIKLSLEATHK